MSRVHVAVRAFRRRRPTALAAALLALLMLIPSVASAAPNPSAIPDVDATWDCDDGLVVTSTKDISNLVLVVDGELVRIYERGIDDEALLSYTVDTDLIEGEISGIYIKSGANGVRGPANQGLGAYVSLEAPDCGPVLRTGDIQVTLRWHADDDLDLEVTDPFGYTVAYYSPTVPSGGFLDVDANVGKCGQNVPPAVENIVWSEGDAVDGMYTVRVREFHLCTGVSPTWQLVIKVGGVVVFDQTGTGPLTTTFDYPYLAP